MVSISIPWQDISKALMGILNLPFFLWLYSLNPIWKISIVVVLLIVLFWPRSQGTNESKLLETKEQQNQVAEEPRNIPMINDSETKTDTARISGKINLKETAQKKTAQKNKLVQTIEQQSQTTQMTPSMEELPDTVEKNNDTERVQASQVIPITKEEPESIEQQNQAIEKAPPLDKSKKIGTSALVLEGNEDFSIGVVVGYGTERLIRAKRNKNFKIGKVIHTNHENSDHP